MANKKKPTFHCKSKAQKKAIAASYAKKADKKKDFPKEFPFWARLKISKNRPTLVIDEEPVMDKKKKEMVDGYVHREVIHTKSSDYEEVSPNPDKTDKSPMYLKRPRKLPKVLFKPHEGNWQVPDYLRERYEKNNKK